MSRPPEPAAAVQEARVVAAHGQHLSILDAHGDVHAARIFGRSTQAVCGDRVSCRRDAQHDIWHVLHTLPRRNALHRSNARGRSELIAANVDLVVVVIAPLPEPDLFVVDRYLAAAASAPAAALLLQNKIDLGATAEISPELSAYARAGYPLLRCSSRTGAGLDELRAYLSKGTALLVGQSGVGKSSLLRTLAPLSDARVGGLVRESEGRHTTTATTLHALPDGGELLDSPGVRDFAPALDRLEPRTLGFVEIASLEAPCRFADCRHYDEPDCRVRDAVDAGAMSARRYESYRRLRRQYDDRIRHMRSGGR